MARKYVRKTERAKISIDLLKRAATKITAGASIRAISRKFNINRATLSRFLVKSKDKKDEEVVFVSGYDRLSKLKCVFPVQIEKDLAQYIMLLSDQFHGLSAEKCRALAFEFAKKNSIQVPANWERENKAGKDWFYSFKGRHKIAVKAPERTSSLTTFNRQYVDKFYNDLAAVVDRYKFSASDIWNLGQTGCSTPVQHPETVVTEKGSLVDEECCELVTLEYCVNAAGNMIPPFFVFPGMKFQEDFLDGAPADSIGRTSRTGCLNEELFVDYIRHFIQHTRCTKERPVLLILENVEAYITIKAIDLVREHGIALLTLPLHSSHRLHPLDVAVYGPFQKAYNSAMDEWIGSHSGRVFTIYDIPTIVSEAQLCAMSQRNIKAGFAATGIYPYNKNILKNPDFSSAAVTECRNPEANANAMYLDPNLGPSSGARSSPLILKPSCGMSRQLLPSSCESVSSIIYPLPKAEPGKSKRKRASTILSDTPKVKDELILEKTKVKPTNDIKQKLYNQTSQKITANITSDDDSKDEDYGFRAMNDSENDNDVLDDKILVDDYLVPEKVKVIPSKNIKKEIV